MKQLPAQKSTEVIHSDKNPESEDIYSKAQKLHSTLGNVSAMFSSGNDLQLVSLSSKPNIEKQKQQTKQQIVREKEVLSRQTEHSAFEKKRRLLSAEEQLQNKKLSMQQDFENFSERSHEFLERKNFVNQESQSIEEKFRDTESFVSQVKKRFQ